MMYVKILCKFCSYSTKQENLVFVAKHVICAILSTNSASIHTFIDIDITIFCKISEISCNYVFMCYQASIWARQKT